MSEQKSRTVNHSEAMVIARAKSTGAGRRLVGGEWLFSHDELVRFHDLLIATGMSEAATLCEGEASEYLRKVWPPHEPCACQETLRQIGDYAHDHSTGPAVPDALWEVRSMAYEGLRECPAPPLEVAPAWLKDREAVHVACLKGIIALHPDDALHVGGTSRNELDNLRPAPPPPDVQAWQPIETAPKDGSLILVYAPGYQDLPAMQSLCAWHQDAGFCIDELREPTHWMPLPEPPK